MAAALKAASPVGNGLLANQSILGQFKATLSFGRIAMKANIYLLAVAMISICTKYASAEPVCYERNYNATHMQKHAKQEITKIRLVLDGGDVLQGQVHAAFRESENYSGGNVECRAKGKVTSCEILADGGEFEFTPTEKGIRLVNTSTMRFGDEEDGIGIGREPEHRVFLLFKTAVEKCSN
jgi:hypothetical protein